MTARDGLMIDFTYICSLYHMTTVVEP